MTSPEMMALAAPMFIALGGMFSAEVAGRVSVLELTRLRILVPAILLGVIATVTSGWTTTSGNQLPFLFASGVIGMVIADAALSGSIFALGARKATLLFSLNAPITATLSYVVLKETLSVLQVVGMVMVLAGIAAAVWFTPVKPGEVHDIAGGRRPEKHWASAKGVALGAIAALAQSISMITAKPVMDAGINAAAAMTIRLSAAAMVLQLIWPILRPKGGSNLPANWSLLRLCIFGSLLGVGVGVTFVFAALKDGNVAVVATFASLTPVAVLPMVWVRLGRPPHWLAWAGAVMACSGIALIFLR